MSRGAGRSFGLLAFFAAVSGIPAGTAAQPRAVAGPPVPGAELTVSVMTMGVGPAVWERFGHNAIIIEDHRRGTSTAYNYGMFSFRQENFLLRFIQGRMLYWMAGYPAEDDIPRYVAAGRSVWKQELNLAPAERIALRDFLEWNARPENAQYRYDYYLDNCSTRVRDAVDRVLGGALHAQTTVPASGSFRFHTQRLNTNNIPLYTGLLLALGHGVDAPVTRWDEMFLPLKLREYLALVRVRDSAGRLVPLVVREDTLFASEQYPVPAAPPFWAPGFLAVGVGLGGLFYWSGRAGRRTAIARRVLAVGGTGWALLTGTSGAVLVGLWGFTDHGMAGRNENVLQCTLFALALGLMLPWALGDRPRISSAARVLATLVGALALLGLLLKLLPGFGQENLQLLALTVPANLGLAAGVRAWTAARPG